MEGQVGRGTVDDRGLLQLGDGLRRLRNSAPCDAAVRRAPDLHSGASVQDRPDPGIRDSQIPVLDLGRSLGSAPAAPST